MRRINGDLVLVVVLSALFATCGKAGGEPSVSATKILNAPAGVECYAVQSGATVVGGTCFRD